MKSKSLKARKTKSLLILPLIFISAFLIYLLLQVALNVSNPILSINSGSMSPTLEPGDLVILQGVSTEEVTTGDLIAFIAPNTNSLTVHRVIEVKCFENGTIAFKTKGDNNKYPDSFLVKEVIGRVFLKIPCVGYLTDVKILIPIILIVLLISFMPLNREKKRIVRKRKFSRRI